MLHHPRSVLGGLEREVGSLGLAVALARARRRVHVLEPLERVGLVAGELGEHERDAVAEVPVLAAAHVHGNHRLERHRLLAAAE